MKKLITILLVLTLCPLSVFAQDLPPVMTLEQMERLYLPPPPPPTEKQRSFALAVAGGVTLLLGGGLLLIPLPWSTGENYELNHDTYCVDSGPNRLNIDQGSCTSTDWPEVRPYGYVLAAAGTAMMVIGMHKVKVSPQLAPGVIGAKASIRW